MTSVRSLSLLSLCLFAASYGLIQRNHQSAMTRGLKLATSLPAGDFTKYYYDQLVDHFDASNTATFKQLYYVNTTFWAPNGPILFIIGGEGPISTAYVTDHFVTGSTYSPLLKAAVVVLEHRFYGESFPTNDTSTAALRLLSSEQALADVAMFRQYFAQKWATPNSKWVVFGGSYAGSLSAWARAKYPFLFDGSFSSSAPVTAKENFVEYLGVVNAAVGTKCADRLRTATASIESMLQTSSGKSKLQTTFNMCSPLNNDKDISTFLEQITDPVAGIVQYNHDNRGTETMDIAEMCAILQNGTDPVLAWANFIKSQQGDDCLLVNYQNYIAQLAPPSSGRSWTYQTCIEYGYFQTGDTTVSPFSPRISLDFFRGICKDVFGTGMPLSPNVAWTNTEFGATSLKPIASNTFFGDGTTDPWHVLAILPKQQPGEEAIGSGSYTVLMNNTAHCADFYAPSDKDVPDLTHARAVFLGMLEKWVKA